MTGLRLRIILMMALVLNLVHPMIHGTFLDGGALDSTLQGLDCWAMSMMGHVHIR